MVEQESDSVTNSLPKRKMTFSVTTLLSVLTICVVLSAWFVDHQRLARQLAPPPESPATVYRLSNVSAELATEKLNEWLEPGTATAETVSNSVVVVADETSLPRVESMICYLDTTGAGLAYNKRAAPKPAAKALPISKAPPISKAFPSKLK